MAEFLAMGGYAFYVWTSYLVVMFLLIFSYFQPGSRRRKIIRALARFYDTTGN